MVCSKDTIVTGIILKECENTFNWFKNNHKHSFHFLASHFANNIMKLLLGNDDKQRCIKNEEMSTIKGDNLLHVQT